MLPPTYKSITPSPTSLTLVPGGKVYDLSGDLSGETVFSGEVVFSGETVFDGEAVAWIFVGDDTADGFAVVLVVLLPKPFFFEAAASAFLRFFSALIFFF